MDVDIQICRYVDLKIYRYMDQSDRLMRLFLELHRADRIASGGVLPFFFDKYTLHLDVKHFLAGGLLFEQESPCW